ncbi:MAG: glutamate-5-semialdehyde dehydrogenase, partial [Clostridia bacterium]|nr:glutamate-5-semialdehyde dehydrogenase [Clostridia bacterium]
LKEEAFIIEANKLDLSDAQSGGRDKSFLDRLELNKGRISDMAQGIKEVAALKDPLGMVTDSWTVENGLKIKKVRVPIGTIAIIYEARPNVTADAVSLCIKSGNAIVLKGSRDAHNSNMAIYNAMVRELDRLGYDSRAIQIIDDKSRESTAELLKQGGYIDVVIPRGGDQLKKYVLDNATMPVIASAGGNCHTYVEKTANLDMAAEILYNAKLSRPSTCNACEQLLVDSVIAEKFLAYALPCLAASNVEIRGCKDTLAIYPQAKAATEEDYYTEHNGYVISVKVLNNTEEAVDWINEHGTKHSEAIITEDSSAAELFTKGVDAACVYVNASTRFTDGFQFGFGAEMGISTQKLHARGPLGLKELTSEKYVIEGKGQIRK